MGFDHVVANMFFLPAGIFADVDLTWWDALHNWIFAFLGNFAGAAIFVAGAYWYLYARPAPSEPTAGGVTVTTEEPEAEPATPTQAPA
jgi:formate transporter